MKKAFAIVGLVILGLIVTFFLVGNSDQDRKNKTNTTSSQSSESKTSASSSTKESNTWSHSDDNSFTGSSTSSEAEQSSSSSSTDSVTSSTSSQPTVSNTTGTDPAFWPKGDWVTQFEKDLYGSYNQTPSRYQYIGNGNWEVWVKNYASASTPYVTVNQYTGYFHG